MESQIFLLALLCGVIYAVPVIPSAPQSTTVVRTNEALSMKYLMDLTECFSTVPSGEEMPLQQQESCLASIGTTRLNTAQSINGLPASKGALIDAQYIQYSLTLSIITVNKLTKGEVKMTFELVKDDDARIDLSVHKHHITVVQSTEPCTVLNSTIQLSVLARTSSRMHLVSSTVLQQSNTTGWIRFNGLSLPKSTSTGSIKLFLVAHNTCDNQMVDLQEIGLISSSSELAAVLVAYSNATDEMAKSLKSTIVQSLSKSLTKRDAGSGASQLMTAPSANPKAPCVTPPLRPCHKVLYNVSISFITDTY